MRPQIFIVIRHGIRADSVGVRWEDDIARPWDSPLALQGWQDAWTKFRSLKGHFPELSPDLVFSSPYVRCLQTASIFLKVNNLTYARLVVDRGLSESYDFANSVRYVESPDIIVQGTYRPMKEWFYKVRRRIITAAGRPLWTLKQGTSLAKQMKSYVYSIWSDKSSPRIQAIGEFPVFEMPVASSFVKNPLKARYVQAFERCSNFSDKYHSKSELPVVAAIVTHRAGVESIFEHLLNRACPSVPPAGYFIVKVSESRNMMTKTNLVQSPLKCELIMTQFSTASEYRNL